MSSLDQNHASMSKRRSITEAMGQLRPGAWAKVCLAGVLALWVGTAQATSCTGTNLMDTLPRDRQEQINAAAADVPYHQGILWRATRGDAQITLVGTLHVDDPRHQKMLKKLEGVIDSAAALYVESGPVQEAQMNLAMLSDPTLSQIDEGAPKWSERMTESEWNALSSAMESRGSSPENTATMSVTMLALSLSNPPCQSNGVSHNLGSLDQLLIDEAQSSSLPIQGLEPWETVPTVFESLTPEQELDLVRFLLSGEDRAADVVTTQVESYFTGDVWRVWDILRIDAYNTSGLSRDEVDEQYDLVRSLMVDKRNHQWMTPLTEGAETAATEGKGVLAAFGARHLPGEEGVLQLLAQDGWTIERLD